MILSLYTHLGWAKQGGRNGNSAAKRIVKNSSQQDQISKELGLPYEVFLHLFFPLKGTVPSLPVAFHSSVKLSSL